MTDTPTPTPAEQAPASLYKYSTWVHVGHGAEDCTEVDEAAGTARCGDPSHFHSWCRIPNPLQEEDIRQRALAAKARKVRAVRTQGSDGNEILEMELETLQTEPDSMERMANEVVGSDWAEDYMAAVRQTRELDDTGDGVDEGTKLFAHIDDDKDRYTILTATPEDERDEDEYLELQSHLATYETHCRAFFEAIQQPKRDQYLAMDDLDLLNLVRRKRIERIGTEEFMRAFDTHMWLSSTYTDENAGQPSFRDLDHLKSAAGTVLSALAEAFEDLQKTSQAAAGN